MILSRELFLTTFHHEISDILSISLTHKEIAWLSNFKTLRVTETMNLNGFMASVNPLVLYLNTRWKLNLGQ